MCPILVRAITQ